MARTVLALTLALLGLHAACGPTNSVNPTVSTGDGGVDRAMSPRPQDGPLGTDTAAPADSAPTPDLAPTPPADTAAPADTPVVVTPDAPADIQLPPDLPPDLPPPPPDLPPDLPPDTQPPGPWFMVAHAAAQPLTNLTTAAPVEWVHFGQGGATRVNRKTGAPMRIAMTPVGGNAVFGYDDRPVRFSWTDGTPTASATGTSEGISNGDQTGRGFELRVQGDVARARQLRVYWGVWGGRARMQVSMSDNSVPAVMDTTLTAGDPGADRITTIQFRTSQANQTLVVRWTIDAITLMYGNVTLQAATLE